MHLEADFQTFQMMYLSFFNFDYSQSYARFSNVSKKRISLQATVAEICSSDLHMKNHNNQIDLTPIDATL